MAAILLAATLCAAVPVFSDEEIADESDADPITLGAGAIFLIGFAVGAIAGGAAVHVIEDLLEKQNDEFNEALRAGEANRLYSVIETLEASYANSLANYSQIWSLTSEHWIREAELSASVLWAPNTAYNPSNIMAMSGVYSNSAMMLADAVAQPNALYGAVSQNIAAWTQDAAYNDKITVSWTYGSQSMGSAASWSGKEVWAVSVPASAAEGQEVYIGSDGYIMCFDSNGSAVGPDGLVSLPSGTEKKVAEGVYTLSAGATYVSDRMLPVISATSAQVRPGVIMTAGGSSAIAIYDSDSGRISVGGVSYDSLGISFKAEGSSASTVDVTEVLKQRQGLLSSVISTMNQADSSAWAVWQIYNDAGSASAYITTLAVPNEYEGVEMSAAQKRIMAVMALQELAGYWAGNSGALLKDYTVTPGSNQLFIRGDIYNDRNEVIAKDAIFTPYYRTQDDSIALGSNTETQAATVAVWATGYTGSLSSWNHVTDHPYLITSKAGYVMDAAEIEYAGESVSSVDLDVRSIDYIEPGKITIVPNPAPDADKDYTALITIAFIAMAILLAFAGVLNGRPGLVVIAVVLAIAGAVGAGTINGWLVNGFSLGGLF
ncbi:hypothetical protein O8W32_06555 [Methanomassiliicoccales archaeon LGM-DZ1]|nr:hypothetical protein O8W32_06555 [Methanomassiliicoccales archaeon LGM-DZ1]